MQEQAQKELSGLIDELVESASRHGALSQHAADFGSAITRSANKIARQKKKLLEQICDLIEAPNLKAFQDETEERLFEDP